MNRSALLILAISSVAHAQQPSSTVEVDEIVVRGKSSTETQSRDIQVLRIDQLSNASRPTLEGALQGQSNIQIVPTPLRGTNLSLNGLSGEEVALFWNGDPILGRVDGALDTRSVALGSVDRISVYQGLDSLPYGSQNVAGTIALEAPWRLEDRTRFRSAGGTFGRLMLDGSSQGSTRGGWHYFAGASSWRTDAVRATPDTADTTSDASARVSGSALVSKPGAGTFAGQDVDVRLGADAYNENSKGVFGSELKEGDTRRMHVYSDLRRGDSTLHLSLSDYSNRLHGLGAQDAAARDDEFGERAVRIVPEARETFGNTTILAGAQADIHSTRSTRINTGRVDELYYGAHLGARHALSDSWMVGGGARWDSQPRWLSPRAEVKHLAELGPFESTTTLETGIGFRAPSPKERFMSFPNPALRYRIAGNPDLLNERGWTTALRSTLATKKLTLRTTVFQMRLRDAIGYAYTGLSGRYAVFTYSNTSQTLTHGFQETAELRLPNAWDAQASYQYLRGRNLSNQSELFLQPRHRVALTLSRNPRAGFTLLGQAAWTGAQGFFDFNRNGVSDVEDQIPAYWTTSLEAGYGFTWPGTLSALRVFGRVDNAFNVTREQALPAEPRAVLLGTVVEL